MLQPGILLDDGEYFVWCYSPALGQGFRMGFLGLLHMDVFCQRLEQEFNASFIVTSPNVPFKGVATPTFHIHVVSFTDHCSEVTFIFIWQMTVLKRLCPGISSSLYPPPPQQSKKKISGGWGGKERERTQTLTQTWKHYFTRIVV